MALKATRTQKNEFMQDGRAHAVLDFPLHIEKGKTQGLFTSHVYIRNVHTPAAKKINKYPIYNHILSIPTYTAYT